MKDTYIITQDSKKSPLGFIWDGDEVFLSSSAARASMKALHYNESHPDSRGRFVYHDAGHTFYVQKVDKALPFLYRHLGNSMELVVFMRRYGGNSEVLEKIYEFSKAVPDRYLAQKYIDQIYSLESPEEALKCFDAKGFIQKELDYLHTLQRRYYEKAN